MKNNDNARSGGIGFLGLLTIVFIVLKLTKVITWQWWWVLSPIWIPTCICLLFALFCVIMHIICKYIIKNKKGV